MTDSGQRPHLLIFQRATVSVDNLGQETPTWGTLTTAYARVRHGTGQERRQAAQETAVQAATFECDWDAILDGVRVNDRISFDRSFWDVKGRAVIGANVDIHFTAVRVN